MNELMIKFLAGFMGIESEVLKAAFQKEDGDDSLLKNFFDGKELWTPEKHSEVIKNAKKEGVKDLLKPGADIPESLYNTVKKAVLDKIEKAYSEKYEIEEFSSTDDLITKIIAKRSKKDGENNKLQDENLELKRKLKEEIDGKADAISNEKNKRLQYIANIALDQEITNLPINAEGDALKINREIARSMFLDQHKIDVTEDEEGKVSIQVLNKDGEVIKDDVLNPVSVGTALTDFASKGYVPLKQPDGRGGKSSDTENEDNQLKGMPENKLAGYIESKGFQPNSEESLKVIREWEKANDKQF